jgi:hypothetical protein
MTDRVQPGAIDSVIRNDELAEALGGFIDGSILPGTDPTNAAIRRGNIDETALNAFAISTSASSFDVSIAPGEAYIDGWCCRDTTTTLTLPSNATTDIVVGWNSNAAFDPQTDTTRDAADETIVARRATVSDTVPQLIAHRVDTDGSGVTTSRRVAPVGALAVDDAEFSDVRPQSLASDYLYARGFSGSTPENRLNAAIAASDRGDSIYLENVAYNNITLDARERTFIGTGGTVGDTDGSTFENGGTISAQQITVKGVGVGNTGALEITADNVAIRDAIFQGTITVDADGVLLTNLIGVFSSGVTFTSGTSSGVINNCVDLPVTDNGNNVVGAAIS